MKAFIPTGDPAEPVRYAEVPEPEPRANEALVKVEAYSINRGETSSSRSPRPASAPARTSRAWWCSRPPTEAAGRHHPRRRAPHGERLGRIRRGADRRHRRAAGHRLRDPGRGKAVLTLS